MIDFDGEFPFLWHLSAESGEGFCAVSMVVPYLEENNQKNLTIETSVLSFSADGGRASHDEMLEWNEDDITLFLNLVNYRRQSLNLPIADTLRVDLSDPAIIEIINVVAAAGFGTAYVAPEVLKKKRGRNPAFHCQIGGFASLHTVEGFKPCAVVDMEDDDVVCVLLDNVTLDSRDDFSNLNRHDLLMVKRSDLLHPGFSVELLPSGGHTLH
jgi:hypothetical protein